MFETFLKPYFFENYRPVHAGEVFPVTDDASGITIDFKIMQVDNEETEYGVVAPETVVYTEGAPLDRSEDPARSEEIGYDDVGGLSKQVSKALLCRCHHGLVSALRLWHGIRGVRVECTGLTLDRLPTSHRFPSFASLLSFLCATPRSLKPLVRPLPAVCSSMAHPGAARR